MKIRFLKKEIYLPSFFKFVFAFLPIVLLILLGLFISGTRNRESLSPISDSSTATLSIDDPSSTAEEIIAPSPSDAPSPMWQISIYIVGEVNAPDVYTLSIGSLLVDAIEAAGGATDTADLKSINLAYPLNNNMMIKIPSVNDSDKNWIIDEGNLFSEPDKAPSAAQTDPSVDEKVNINKATVSQLCSLPGIGESTAKKIVDYRDKNGPFESIYDITNINGIKDAKYEQIKDYITVDD